MPNIIPPKENSVNSKTPRLIFFGTPEFAVPSLKELINSDFCPVAVVTAPDKSVGRHQTATPPPIKILAQKYKIPALQPERLKDQNFIEKFKNLKPDLVALTAYRKIIPKEILDIPRWGCLNVHPSLLPKYRGASPIQSAILNGEEETGVAVFKMDEKMDEGPILTQKSLPIEPEETAITLHKKLSELAAQLLMSTIEKWVTFNAMPKKIKDFFSLQPQNHQQATYTKILTKQDGKILWNKSSQEIARQIRAFAGWPGTYCLLPDGKKLKIIKAIAIPETTPEIKNHLTLKIKQSPTKEYGQVFLTQNNELAVQTSQGSLLVQELQLEGKKLISSREFLNGYPEIVGKVLK